MLQQVQPGLGFWQVDTTEKGSYDNTKPWNPAWRNSIPSHGIQKGENPGPVSGLLKDSGKSGGLRISIGSENFWNGSPGITELGRHTVTDSPAEVVTVETSEVLPSGQGLRVPVAAATWRKGSWH